jgi:hypothetical protein
VGVAQVQKRTFLYIFDVQITSNYTFCDHEKYHKNTQILDPGKHFDFPYLAVTNSGDFRQDATQTPGCWNPEAV